MRAGIKSAIKPLRVFYALGPGDAVTSYRHWKAGEDLLSETSRTFSGQFFDFCRQAGHSGYAISSFAKPEKLDDKWMIVENRPKRLSGNGIQYHVSQALYAVSIMLAALRWRADVVLVDSGTTHWVLLTPLKLAGKRVVGVLHNVPWPAGHKPTGMVKRIILASDGWFWRYIADAVVSVSPECERQVYELAGGRKTVAIQCRAQFNRGDFASIPAATAIGSEPFRVVFAGRVERDKGALDIVEIARLLELECPGRVQFDVCGGGSAFEELVDSIRRQGLGHAVRVHGKLNRPALLKIYAASHAFIVPTRSDFPEGMAMVAIEGILCGRPVITSRVVPAAEVLREAVVIATADDPRSYADAIRLLSDDAACYERLRAACPALQEQFYDPGRSLAAAFEAVVADRSQQML
jgi:glycosyltransferase involved in cell wall biosynthesis